MLYPAAVGDGRFSRTEPLFHGIFGLLAKSIVGQLFPVPSAEEFGELFFYDRAEKMLPLGVFYRARYGGDMQGPAQKRPENSRR